MDRWRGRPLGRREQVVNACDDFPNLDPVSVIPALSVRSDWAATLPGQEIPLIWEVRHGDREEDDRFC